MNFRAVGEVQVIVISLTLEACHVPAFDPEDRMIFMINSRPKVGVTRAQLIAHLTKTLDPATWDLIRNGILSSVFYKVGVEPGFFAVLSAPTIEQAQAIVDSSAQRQEVFDLEIVPIKQFPHFD